jgi:hypothetical protein
MMDEDGYRQGEPVGCVLVGQALATNEHEGSSLFAGSLLIVSTTF